MIEQILLYLTKMLYPSGRVFRLSKNTTIEKIHKGLIVSEEGYYNEVTGILDSILPDNDNFTEDDAADWERRLGMISGIGNILSVRKSAIGRKYGSPGNVKGRQHYLYLQSQLRAAGFDVYVHENTPVAQDPSDFAFYVDGTTGLSGLGSFGLGDRGLKEQLDYDKIANSLDSAVDQEFELAADLRAAFFIGGSVKGSAANVPINREKEFRQLTLNIKPLQTVAVLFINYV